MGRSPLSGWLLLRRLRQAGLTTNTFAYTTSLENFAEIRQRLISKIERLSRQGEYVLIGHSLGGVLLRAALNSLPAGTHLPRHLFLLGSPLRPARLAQKLGRNLIYRTLTQDCGQLLGSEMRMSEVGSVHIPTTSIVGIRGMPWKLGRLSTLSLFDDELNDGVVAISEVSAEWLTDQMRVPTIHTLLPTSKQVADIILERIGRKTA